jgi:ABC-type multidrug transport system fused ATPase/permease subunit
VLLLDEPTAALDSQSEKLVIEALLNVMKRAKSMVMVTHRLGVIRSLNVNRVIVLDRGRIVEEGHPEDLLRNPDGLYASLAREQGIRSATSTI